MNNNAGNAGFDLHQVLPCSMFSGEKKLTVTVIPMIGDRLVLVHPAKVTDEVKWLVPPQSSMRRGETAINAATRVLRNALGLKNFEEKSRIVALGTFDNPIPDSRGGGVKQHFVVGVRLPQGTHPMIDRDNNEVSRFDLIEGPAAFARVTEIVKAKRPTKHGMMVEALKAAHIRGICSWSIPDPLVVH